jgi:predicted aldo/keto reductase-like oxidoreductase
VTDDGVSRREFLKGAGAASAGALGSGGLLQPSPPASAAAPVPHRAFGRTGVQISALGLGGYHLGSVADPREANEIVARALDAGINFFDNAWEYHDGESEQRLGRALAGKRDRAFVMTKVCTHGRSKQVAMRMLEESLRRLRTDHVDLWQIHEVIYDSDPDRIFDAGGAAEALAAAKQQGKVRFVGFTGHKHPAIHLAMLRHDFPFDAVQMPLNCFDATFRSFEVEVLPEVNRRGMAALGMKSLGGSGEMVVNGGITAAEGLRYAMSLPVATTISGVDSMDILLQNLSIAGGFTPMSDAEMGRLRESCRRLAADGRLELFKTTKKYDGDIGRREHEFPTVEELPA